MEDNIQKLASMGRFEDDQIAHVATGEMIVPPVISPVTRMMIEEDMLNQGMDPNQYIVGGNPSINPRTGLQEFFIKKLFKKIKKVVKKVAPIAVSFIPGIGPVAKGALTAVAGKASGMSTKDALLGGLTAGLGAKFAAGKAGAAGVAGEAAKTGRFSRLKNFFNPAEGAKGLAGGTFGPNIRRGIGNIFGGGLGSGQQEVMMPEGDFTMVSGGQQDYKINPLVTDLYQKGEITYQEGFDGIPGYFINRAGDKFYSPEAVEAAYSAQPTGLGRFFRRDPKDKGSTPQIIKSIGDIFGFGGRSGTRDVYGDDGGSFFGFDTPGPIKGIEDVIKGQRTDDSAGGLAALAALYGLATKKAAEKTEGGLRDIRLSTRPDLMPQQTFQGFDVGVRPGMLYGGRMDEQELDLRMGGPSEGPGTETSDDIPAMLSDGEFVMTAAANKGLGGFKIEKNKDSLTIFPTGQPDREQGFKNNDKLMKFFENYQEMMS